MVQKVAPPIESSLQTDAKDLDLNLVVKQSSTEMVMFLLSKGADSYFAIASAAAYGKVDLLKQLLAVPDVDLKKLKPEYLVSVAIAGQDEAVKVLVKAGADPAPLFAFYTDNPKMLAELNKRPSL